MIPIYKCLDTLSEGMLVKRKLYHKLLFDN